MYKNWINGLLGLVVIALAFLNLSEVSLTWTLGVIGAIIAANSFWSLATEADRGGDSMHSNV